MKWFVCFLIGAFGLLSLGAAWGLARIRRGYAQASTEICSIELSEIEGLAQECVDVFSQKLGITLDPNDWQSAVIALDDAFDSKVKGKMELAFSRPEFRWYFTKPVGAFFGELLRRHANQEWQANENAAPSMKRSLNDGSFEAFPFDKILKHYVLGERGDLFALMTVARTADLAISKLPPN